MLLFAATKMFEMHILMRMQLVLTFRQYLRCQHVFICRIVSVLVCFYSGKASLNLVTLSFKVDSITPGFVSLSWIAVSATILIVSPIQSFQHKPLFISFYLLIYFINLYLVRAKRGGATSCYVTV